jgi:hypothetical protein
VNGHHLIVFSTSIDNQTSLSLSKLNIRSAALWIMIGTSPSSVIASQSITDTVQLHHLSHKHSQNMTNVVNKQNLKPVNKKQSRRKRRKRKDNNESESDSNSYYFNENSYDHITNNGNHIIKSKRNNSKRRNVKSINIVNRNDPNLSINTKRGERSLGSNLTLWIFRMKQNLKDLNINDEVTF